MKGTNMTIRTDMEKLTDVLRGDLGSDYAIGWLQSMVAELEYDSDLKLNKRQKAALKAFVTKNIEWAQYWSNKDKDRKKNVD